MSLGLASFPQSFCVWLKPPLNTSHQLQTKAGAHRDMSLPWSDWNTNGVADLKIRLDGVGWAGHAEQKLPSSSIILHVKIQVTNKALSVFSSHPLFPKILPIEKGERKLLNRHPKSSFILDIIFRICAPRDSGILVPRGPL